jgi:oligosaccharyltransferase complex subunit beta
MLDPYIRQTMKFNKTQFEVEFRLPDHYGVFTFKVEYIRNGYSNIEKSDNVQIRPYRHDQYPRFLVIAYPYYVNLFSMMGGFFVFSMIFLFHRENVSEVKKTE